MNRKVPPLLVIGAAERVNLPDWGIRRLRAKIDTGACNSALHVAHIEEIGTRRVRFDVLLNRKTNRRVRVETDVIRRAQVRPSNGVAQVRIFVATRLELGDRIRRIELSLVDRSNMSFRMLLGRSALEHQFLVDVSKRYLVETPRRSTKAHRA